NPWQFIGVPADADSICTVGAIDSLGNVTGFSSKGPTADGRFKPDLVSRGGNAYVANSFGSYSPGNGTSFSCPVMAGAVACFWQRHSTFTNMQVLDTLRKYASNSLAPDNSRGWGIPNMCSLPVGLSKYTKELGGVRLFPNPVKSQLSIATELRNMIYYSVSNVLGQVVLKGSFIESIKVNIESLPKGYYTITLSDGSSTKNEKILVG
ncbi:MAG: S8/S53 family peptidase, partial [Bacteroidia bacterium]